MVGRGGVGLMPSLRPTSRYSASRDLLPAARRLVDLHNLSQIVNPVFNALFYCGKLR